jgi:hypothetical protein
VDYGDFESDNHVEGQDEDSFNEDIIKLYENHKKNNVGKNTEAQRPNHRPISSYLRNMQGERKDGGSSSSEERNINVSEIVTKFNKFVNKNNISFNEFCDNPDIFIEYDTFKDLFKKIRFDVTNSETKALFTFGNRLAKEGYILMKNFFNTFKEVRWKNMSMDSTNTDYDIQKLNNEFKNLHKEVLEIVNKENNKNNKFGKIKTARIQKVDNLSKTSFQRFDFKNEKETLTDASQSLNSFTQSQRDSFYPKIGANENQTKSSRETQQIKLYLSQRIQHEQLEDQRIKEDIQRVS